MRHLFIGIVLIFTSLLIGCGGKDYKYVEDHELKPGPGLFSGEDGTFTVYEGSIPNKEKTEGQEEPDKKE